MSNYSKVTIDHLVDTIGPKEEKHTSLAVLMGAGMSVTAGIPLASDIVKDIREKYPNKVKDLKYDEKAAYQKHMEKLFRREGQKLIREYTDPDKVKINWAHIFLAQLIKEKVVDRVLTVNFDNVLAQALALFGIYPAIYDFAASQHFDPGSVYDPSVFHLHGQMEGFKILNTEEETEKQRKKDGFKGLFENTKSNRALLVIGYSGSSDPVFERLAEQDYNNGLYWIGYEDNPPSEDVKKNLLKKDGWRLISGYNADSFFDELRLKLIGEQPLFIDKPFTYIKNTVYEKIGGFKTENPKDNFLDTSIEANRLDTSLKWINKAIDIFENQVLKSPLEKIGEFAKDLLTQHAQNIWTNKRYSELEAFWNECKNNLTPKAKEYVSYAFNNWGATLDNPDESIEKYKRAIQVNHNNSKAYNNWGAVLGEQGEHNKAIEKYQKAIEIKQDYEKPYYNWGNALMALEKYSEAVKKLQKAIEIKPDYVEARNNCGLALYELKKYTEAIKKYQKTIEIRPDDPFAYNNWGKVLSAQKKYPEATEKYRKAIQLKPDYAETYFNWGWTLDRQKKLSDAIKKYQKAVQIKPDYVSAYVNLLELTLGIDNESQFNDILGEFHSNCDGLNSRDENIKQGLIMLVELKWKLVTKETVKQFHKNLLGNVPLKKWNFDNLERFYKQIKKAETKKRVRLVLDAWQGKIDPDEFHKKALTWVSKP